MTASYWYTAQIDLYNAANSFWMYKFAEKGVAEGGGVSFHYIVNEKKNTF